MNPPADSATKRNFRGRPAFVPKRVLPPAPDDSAETTVTATVQAVVFASQSGDFAVLRGLDPKDERVVLKGALAHLRVGETLECEGAWKNHPQHGWAFQVDSAKVSQPNTLAGIAAYMESAVPGVGPIWARAIAETLGEGALEQIDADPKILYRVRTPNGRKMPVKMMRSIIESWDEARAIRKVMVFLTSHGVTSGIASRLYRHYGDKALKILQEDPYRIVEIRGIGFRIADRIARNLNVPLESPQRIQAGIVFCLQEAEGAGHCFLREGELADTVREQLLLGDHDFVEDHPAFIADQLRSLIEQRKIVIDAAEDENRLYLPELFHVERRLARNLKKLVNSEPAKELKMPERPTEGDFIPNDGQWQAIENALTSRVSLITGLPGTGKTTLVKLLLQVIDGQPTMAGALHNSLLASPTGKAARRLTEASEREAQTIHRMLQWAGASGGFIYDENNPLEARFVIVDETSMVDMRLADALVRAIGPFTHLVLVGDADQLPPVGAGKVFEDMISSGAIPSVRLTEIFRQAARSLIVRNAHRIVTGKAPFKNAKEACTALNLDEGDIDEDYFFVQRDEPEDVAAAIVDFAAERIPKTYGLDPIRDVLVLAPMKRGACGLEALNRQLQQRLNPNGQPVGGGGLRVGDRIIQTRNDYTMEVMNGEVGVIDSFDADASEVIVDFGDRTAKLTPSDLDSFLPAYAISVHRSQGSQAQAVVCATATTHYIMLTRSLVNTAITRAQKLCVCVGQPRALRIAVETVDARRRNTALAERLR
jgi:exodeoxyribonuclease V alpha subunit